jgi:hypothetical protein
MREQVELHDLIEFTVCDQTYICPRGCTKPSLINGVQVRIYTLQALTSDTNYMTPHEEVIYNGIQNKFST